MVSRRQAIERISGGVAAGLTGASSASGAAAPILPPHDLQLRYDALAAADGGTLEIPAGITRASLVLHSRRVHLRGAGRGATILEPADPSLPILAAGYADAAWDAVTISDLTLRGGGELAGIGLGYSSNPNELYAGRTIIRNVAFANLERCISRPQGNIGLWLEDCQFEESAYHLWGEAARTPSGSVMHSGVLIARRCHFQGASRAVLRIRSDVAGSGQVTFEECIFENNPGFVLVFERFEAREGVPGVVVRSCWNERNGTGGRARRLELGGREWEPAFLFADRVASIEFEDTPPGRTILLGDTAFTTRGCALDLFDLVHADSDAGVLHHDARVFDAKLVQGLTNSLVNANLKNGGSAGAVFRLPHRSALIHPTLSVPHVADACLTPIPITGSRSSVTVPARDAVLPGASVSQEVRMAAGDTLILGDTAVPPGSFVAWTVSYRLVEGTAPVFQVTGDMAVSVPLPLTATDWTTIGGITAMASAVDHIGFWLRSTRPGAVRVGGYQLICFPTRQAATQMLNDRLFRSPSR